MARTDQTWLRDALADPANGWSVGTFGAIAEFTRDADEPAEVTTAGGAAAVATGRGAIRLAPSDDMAPVAYETPNRDGETWNHAVALCLPASLCAMNRRTALTELGPDREAIRPGDRGATLFDMGLGILSADICIRTADPGLITALRAETGRSLLEPGNPAMSRIVAAGPHRVFVSRIARGEVYQPIPPADGRSPDGPHTHVLPKLLRSGRTHAATVPIPEGLVPCAHLFPPNPLKDAMGRRKPFSAGEHARFQALYGRFAGPEAVRIKRELAAALADGARGPVLEVDEDRHGRALVRVALRQARAAGASGGALERLSEAFDRGREPEPAEDEEQASHQPPGHGPQP